jgi:hypothetical protein
LFEDGCTDLSAALDKAGDTEAALARVLERAKAAGDRRPA